MKVTIENKKGLNKDLKVLVDKKTLEGYLNEKYDEISKTVHLKGFRPGKVPKEVIKIMRRSIKPTSFRLWRKRVNQKSIKHRKKFEYSRKEITGKIKKGDYL